MSENALELRHLGVRYGSKEVLREVSFAVPRSAVYALLGRNAAGKSSLVRCLLGQQRPQAGSALLLSKDSWRHRAELMTRVGVIPEDNEIPPLMTPRQLARFLSPLHRQWDAEGFERRLRRFRIGSDDQVQTLSKGQRRQVSLASALAHHPELLVLDDPTLGLDAVARKALFEELIENLADHGTTVLLTTHDLTAADLVASHVGILSAGRLVVNEELESLKRRWREPEISNRSLALRSGSRATGAAVHDAMEDERGATLEEIFTALVGDES